MLLFARRFPTPCSSCTWSSVVRPTQGPASGSTLGAMHLPSIARTVLTVSSEGRSLR